MRRRTPHAYVYKSLDPDLLLTTDLYQHERFPDDNVSASSVMDGTHRALSSGKYALRNGV